jgi:hypothetical protein
VAGRYRFSRTLRDLSYYWFEANRAINSFKEREHKRFISVIVLGNSSEESEHIRRVPVARCESDFLE